MSDISFAVGVSNSRYSAGMSGRHTTRMNTQDHGKDGDLNADAIESDTSQDTASSEPVTEESEVVGAKRARGHDDSEESRNEPGGYHLRDDPITAIVTRAKRLRISDSTTDDRDNEVHRTLTAKKNKEKEKLSHQITIPESFVIPETSSLVGLPEELIIDILADLDVMDIMALRRTNRRLAHVTRARVLWITRMCLLLDHIQLPESPTTFLNSLLSTPALEHAVLRPHIFDYKWFHSVISHVNPTSSKALSTGWSKPQNIRLPILLPGGRWLVAAFDDGRSSSSGICLWDLDHGKLKWFPEAQMVAEGRLCSLDVKMDQKGAFGFMTVLSEKDNIAGTVVSRVDVYKVVLRTEADASKFHYIDSLPLNERRAFEVQIYPQHGRVLIDLFDRVLIWAYAPINMCAWMVTSLNRHQRRRFSHRSAHAITHTHSYILVADGDECALRAFPLPLLLNRPTQLGLLGLYVPESHLQLHLPSFAVSLRFSSDRSVDISRILATPKLTGLSATVHPNPAGAHVDQGEENHLELCSDACGRGVLFIDAAACDSYILCSFPIHDILPETNSSDAVFFSFRDRRQVHEQARTGSSFNSGTNSTNARPFFIPSQMGGRVDSGGKADALWVGTLGDISSTLMGIGRSPVFGVRNVVLMRSPDYDGGLMILSAINPPIVNLGPGQSRIIEVEQGVGRTVLEIPAGENVGTKLARSVRVEEASVDQVSGRVCVVETITVADRARNHFDVRCGLRLLEYA